MSTILLTDSRRVKKLRAALEEMAPWLAPEWAGLNHKGDFGAALYEVAARLAEHSTRRLDQTALRDKLAFLEMLDISAPAPRSATVPIVFMLAEKRTDPVYAPPRVQIAAAGGDEPVIFETREAIAITPARLLRIVAADPGADRIELAPPEVIAAPKALPPPVTYRLVSAAEPRKKVLQLAQAVGLGPGDLLRIGVSAYRIEKRTGEMVTLVDELETSVPAGTEVAKITSLESFALRNLSEHLAYVGHKELLKLDGKATIAVRFDPPSLVRRLTQLDIAYELWGKSKVSDRASWQPLRLLGGRDSDLRLRKDWEGAVEEVEVNGRKSRWIRLRLLTAIADSAAPDTRVASVEFKVSSTPPDQPKDGPKQGSQSIVAAFYNGLPLPLTTAFLPFGPEPQRFDTFAIAAPEALTKKGATVTLDVGLSDASLVAIVLADQAPDRAYGIASNGRLQAIRFDSDDGLAWRQLDRPVPPQGTGESGIAPLLDGKAPLLAIHSSADAASDLILAMDKAKQLWLAQVAVEGTERTARKWVRVKEERAQPPTSLCLVQMAPDAKPPPPPLIVASDLQGIYMRSIDVSAVAIGAPQPLDPDPAGAAPRAPLMLAQVSGAGKLVVAVDPDGALYRGSIGSGRILWKQLAKAGTVDPKVPVAASQDEVPEASSQDEDGTLRVIAAASGDTVLVSLVNGSEPIITRAALLPTAVKSLPEGPGGASFPLAAAVSKDGVLLLADKVETPIVANPAGAASASFCALLRPASGDRPPALLIGAPDELLFHAPIRSEKRDFPIEWFDALWLDPTTTEALYFQRAADPPQRLSPKRIKIDSKMAAPLPSLGITVPASLTLFIPRGPALTGTRVTGDARQLKLDPQDALTQQGDVIEIGSLLVEVASVTGPAGARIAALATDLPPRFTSYRTLRKAPGPTMEPKDLRTLVRLSGAQFPEETTTLRFDSPAKPSWQTFTKGRGGSAGETWLQLRKQWATAPNASTLSLPSLAGISKWAQVRLPRGTENPELSWEYFDGRGWRRLDKDFVDRTGNLASSGKISFTVPDDLSPTDVAGKQDYWIRARLVGGDYGQPTYIVVTEPPNRQSIRVDRSSLNPPEIISIEATYDLQLYADPQIVLTVNNLASVDQSQAAAAAGAEFTLFESLAAHTLDRPGLGPAIYLCLSRAPGVEVLSLYADAAEINSAPVRLEAQALLPEGWAPIVCDDETAGLTRAGRLRLFLSPEPAQLPLFGCDGWWLRLRPIEVPTGWAPRVRSLHLNAVTAEQAKSLRQEILGSSLGAPNQIYALAEAPMLPETLELRVRESLSEEEMAELRSADPAAVVTFTDVEGEWVRWQATDSFAAQGGAARIFRLDPATGLIRFGNGQDGKIPPAGRDSVRAIAYQSGGGSRGNLPAFAVSQLKTALESVELAVNPVESGGGADAPTQDRLAETAPARLRSANRALAPTDIEALATGSSPDVVRARCLRGHGCGIELVVAIRKTGERCPIPSLARREGIARNIAAAGWGALAPEAIHVRPPRYVHVRVAASVVARSSDAVAQVENDVRKAIAAFLDPIEGGPRGLGWPFGRRPWPSDVQRVVAAVAGVDRVEVAISPRDPGIDLARMSDDALVCIADGDIDLAVQPPGSAR